MTKAILDLDLYAGFSDDLLVDVYLFQGQECEECLKVTYSIEDMVEEFVAVRQNYNTGVLEGQFIGDADCLAARLRAAADTLEAAVEKAYEADK